MYLLITIICFGNLFSTKNKPNIFYHSMEVSFLCLQTADLITTYNGIKVFRIKWKSINTEDGKNEIRKNIQNFLDFYKNA